VSELRDRRSSAGWTWAASRPSALLSWAVVAGVTAALLSGFFLDLDSFGAHDWDQMESHRELVVDSILRFGQFPFWDPYGCGGFPAWGAPESGTNAVSPFLPAYLAWPLAIAIRVEVAALVVALVLGCWFFARPYVRTPIGLGFVCIVAALSSRTALQAAVGHTWHLQYAGLPWVLGAWDRACAAPLAPPAARGARYLWLAFAAIVFASMTYGGGVYPVPHTALCLACLAAYRSVRTRDPQPMLLALAIVVTGGLLAMPKVLPVAETMAQFPRLVRSRETIDPRLWPSLFLGSVGDFPGFKAPGLDYHWHEYGQYVGVIPLVLVLWANLGKLRGESDALRSLRFVGWVLMALALGGWGPWIVLHLVPPFRSQHVPSRFTYPAFMLFAPVAAHVVETRAVALHARLTRGRARLLSAGIAVAFVASGAAVAREDATATAPWFRLHVPAVAPAAGPFVQYASVPQALRYGDGEPDSPGGTNGPPSLAVYRAGIGSIRCSTAPMGADNTRPGPPVRVSGFGAFGIGDPAYRGEFWLSSEGRVSLVRWSPNEIELSVAGAQSGEKLVLNQNWAPGWRANGAFTENERDLNAYVLKAPEETVTFRYRPRTLMWGVLLAAFGALVLPGAWLFYTLRSRSNATLAQSTPPLHAFGSVRAP
jgi:hypothetical protein